MKEILLHKYIYYINISLVKSAIYKRKNKEAIFMKRVVFSFFLFFFLKNGFPQAFDFFVRRRFLEGSRRFRRSFLSESYASIVEILRRHVDYINKV